MSETCDICGRKVSAAHCWPCLCEENKVLREMLEETKVELAEVARSRDEAWMRCGELEGDGDRLRQALRDVCSPMQALLRDMTDEQRCNVNNIILVNLCNSVGFIQEIARKALEVGD